jgi:hypothetical protein
MPIRTHRGRAAVYRRLWGWPLRSPKHLVLAVVLFGAAATAVGLLLPSTPPPHPTRPSAVPVRPSHAPAVVQTTTASPPTLSVPQFTPPSTPPDPQGLEVLDSWATQWVNHPPGTSQQQWLDRLRPFTTDEWIAFMRSIDLATVPTTITGSPRPVSSTATSMQVRLPTNQGDVVVSLVNTPQGWRVTEYD